MSSESSTHGQSELFIMLDNGKKKTNQLVFVFSNNPDHIYYVLHMDAGVLILIGNNIFDFFVIKPTRCTNFTNLYCHENLNVSDSSSVHHQEFIHCTLSNGICHTSL